ncbi:TetR/AcrR family transcriptional regulator [Streptomyces sp. NPDC001621]|uniref:TetR/AcrR family transcriptional regulator n=1 Tax=Streptomyces sp. NPDC001621 TaxID=3364594 RepID=UPI00369901EF
MGRVSQAQAQANRQRVVERASQLFREQGVGVSIADLMKAAGLTHGGFYKQFASKEALIDEAVTHAFGELAEFRATTLEEHEGHRVEAQQSLIDGYLSVRHRDNPASGCPVAALATDMARDSGDRGATRAYAQGVQDFTQWLATDDEDGIARLCTMLGALLLARATKDSPLSGQVLSAARAALSPAPQNPVSDIHC